MSDHVTLTIRSCYECPYVGQRRDDELMCRHHDCEKSCGEQVIGWVDLKPPIPDWCPLRKNTSRG